IRDLTVTGVQTCALPICVSEHGRAVEDRREPVLAEQLVEQLAVADIAPHGTKIGVGGSRAFEVEAHALQPVGQQPAHKEVAEERSEEHTSELQSQSNLVC